MMYLRWTLCAPLSLAFNLFCMATAPVWALWAAALKLDKLPGWFAVVHTHDNWIYGFGHPKPDVPAKFRDRFRLACWWIARNPGYGFDAWVLGFKGPPIFEKGGVEVKFDTGRSASRFDIMRAPNGRRYWSYRADIALWRGRFIKVWLGWQTRTQAGWHILKFDFNPFKKVAK